MKALIPEPVPPHKKRKGGAVNLMLAALMLEAVRMVEEGYDVPSVEQAGKAAFGSGKGFLSWMDETGLVNAVKFLFYLSRRDGGEDNLSQKYDNFFSPPEVLKKRLARTGAAGPQGVKWAVSKEAEKIPSDALTLNMLIKRFLAVSFMIAAELVEEGLLTVPEAEKSCGKAFLWKDGPFNLMNQTGIPEALTMVTERMELSHRKEINFPVPQLLIDQAQKNKLWNLEDGG